jgi:hypothetical protein
MPLSRHHIFAFLDYVKVAVTPVEQEVSAAKAILRVSKRVSRRGPSAPQDGGCAECSR